jgi:hypothetical protein
MPEPSLSTAQSQEIDGNSAPELLRQESDRLKTI